MSDRSPLKGLPVPRGRLSRLARFGGMATGLAGGVLLGGARELASGRRPRLEDLLLTPANALRVTRQLAQLRGAAMKMGQLLSMDSGEFLPRELTEILARLRAEADMMPRGQLQAVLDRAWGRGWQSRFRHFEWRPVAAASIGQVHRAVLNDGRTLAVKVQYPGVRASIDSDVDNVASLIRLSGLAPASLDFAPLLAEAKRQLHEEADYLREAAALARFAALLADAPGFLVPETVAELTTADVLAMHWADGVPIESLAAAPQAERDDAAARMIQLILRELFEFRLMQTDPNFANYRWDRASDRLVLLDFGATRAITAHSVDGYRRLAAAGLAGDRAAVWAAARDIGLVADAMPADRRADILDLSDQVMAPLRRGQPFDFADGVLATKLRAHGMEFASDRRVWHLPPPEALFLQRKFGGIYLLATRLRARVDVRALLEPWL